TIANAGSVWGFILARILRGSPLRGFAGIAASACDVVDGSSPARGCYKSDGSQRPENADMESVQRIVLAASRPESVGEPEGSPPRRRPREPSRPPVGRSYPPGTNVYLHYVFDLWVHRWRLTKASGDMIVVRYADDTIVGFQHEHEARTFLDELK